MAGCSSHKKASLTLAHTSPTPLVIVVSTFAVVSPSSLEINELFSEMLLVIIATAASVAALEITESKCNEEDF